jgi:hypothetical protein
MFLEIITRTFGKRPTWLAENQASLAGLTDCAQTLVIDEQGRGTTWANQNLATVPATGEYVWVLDDDDVCVHPALVADLQALAPFDVCMVRADHAVFGVLPHEEHWRNPPVLCDIGFSNFVVRGPVWNAHRAKFATWDVYWADFMFIEHLFRQNLNIIWHDVIAARYPRRSLGAAE